MPARRACRAPAGPSSRRAAVGDVHDGPASLRGLATPHRRIPVEHPVGGCARGRRRFWPRPRRNSPGVTKRQRQGSRSGVPPRAAGARHGGAPRLGAAGGAGGLHPVLIDVPCPGLVFTNVVRIDEGLVAFLTTSSTCRSWAEPRGRDRPRLWLTVRSGTRVSGPRGFPPRPWTVEGTAGGARARAAARCGNRRRPSAGSSRLPRLFTTVSRVPSCLVSGRASSILMNFTFYERSIVSRGL